MPGLALKPSLDTVDLSRAGGPSSATVVVVGLPKDNVAVVFGVRSIADPDIVLQLTETYFSNAPPSGHSASTPTFLTPTTSSSTLKPSGMPTPTRVAS